MEFKHLPVMLNECIENLQLKPTGIYVDATIGGAGHSKEIAKRLNKQGTLIGIDKDTFALSASREKLSKATCKTHFIHSDFKDFSQILLNLNIEKVDGILVDLGVSSHQIDTLSRGFSYKFDAPLDMRMDATQSLTAFEVVNNYDEKTLTKILFDYGEEAFSKQIVRNIIAHRQQTPIKTTRELASIIEKSIPAKIRFKKGDGAFKKTFQALRIAVNDELNSLQNALSQMISALKTTGRLCVISFHSLEDRIVKNTFRQHATDCICPKTLPVCVCNHRANIKQISKKPLTPSALELAQNPRSSSAKLRVIEKL